jgi:hypothetical protein
MESSDSEDAADSTIQATARIRWDVGRICFQIPVRSNARRL